mmetsp:Transcript_24014/g.50646  ORF Transcript_24014/g.50646 Transcript_24014/m.50646 type:complete len:220 (+) Transcript_24014:429-1088(+)
MESNRLRLRDRIRRWPPELVSFQLRRKQPTRPTLPRRRRTPNRPLPQRHRRLHLRLHRPPRHPNPIPPRLPRTLLRLQNIPPDRIRIRQPLLRIRRRSLHVRLGLSQDRRGLQEGIERRGLGKSALRLAFVGGAPLGGVDVGEILSRGRLRRLGGGVDLSAVLSLVALLGGHGEGCGERLEVCKEKEKAGYDCGVDAVWGDRVERGEFGGQGVYCRESA